MSAPRVFPGGVKMIGAMPPGSIARYEHVAPAALVDAWRGWGQIATADGFIRAIDPDALGGIPAPPALDGGLSAFTTAWGDVLTLAAGWWHLVSYRTGVCAPLFRDDDDLFDRLEDSRMQRDVLLRDGYDAASADLGEPEAHECIGLVRPLARGGALHGDNLARRRLETHLRFLARFCGVPREFDEVPTAGPERAAEEARQRLRLLLDERSPAPAAPPGGTALPLTPEGLADVLAWAASRTGYDVLPARPGSLGSYGDMETEVVVEHGGDGFVLRERQRGTGYTLARGTHLADVLRYLVVHIVLEPVRASLPDAFGIRLDVDARDVGEGIEIRWDAGDEHVVTGYGDRNSADLLARRLGSSVEQIAGLQV